MKYIWLKIFASFSLITIFCFSFMPVVVSADAPPPPPVKIIFTSSGAPISFEAQNISIIFGKSQQKVHKASACLANTCYFNNELFLLGDFKVSIDVPSKNKTYISNSLNREYLGYYGRDTVTTYHVDLKDDGSANLFTTGDKYDSPYQPIIKNSGKSDDITTPEVDDLQDLDNFSGMIIASTLLTLILEIIIASIFILFKKAPKRILLGVLIGNIISVPILWVLVSKFWFLLFPAEIAVVIFEAWLLLLFSQKKLGWRICLVISLAMNLISFIVGPVLFNSLILSNPTTPISQNGELQNKEQSAQSQIPKNIPEAHNAFGFDSFKIIAKEEGNKNVFISPSSIALALSMVYNGAGGETKTAMQKTLHFQKLSNDIVNQESLGLVNVLKNPDTKVELAVANSVWVKNGMNIKEDFLKLVTDYFKARISNVDFSNVGTVKTINSWVSNNTKGKISKIIDPPISPGMMMYLINAVYFKGNWTDAFDKTLTRDRDFTSASGISEKHPLMSQHGDMQYLETKDFQSVSLPYGKNERLSMYVFLPKDLKGLNNFVQTLDGNKWNGWMKQFSQKEGTILLPKFKMEYEKELVPTLRNLGMGVAFGGSADFSGIGDSLAISEVKHKTYIDVNEEGTEAAAVTSIGMMTTAIPGDFESRSFYMEVNHPFFFAIRDNQMGEILFMGTIQNPQK